MNRTWQNLKAIATPVNVVANRSEVCSELARWFVPPANLAASLQDFCGQRPERVARNLAGGVSHRGSGIKRSSPGRGVVSQSATDMSSTHLSLHYHIVFGTKNHEPVIQAAWRGKLHAYLGGIIRTADGVAESIGGVSDHVHLLIGLRATHRLADVLRELKAVSSRCARRDWRAYFCVAGGLWRIYRERFPEGRGPSIHWPTGGTPSHANIPGRIFGTAATQRGGI
jgi:REP element-mobilizing transposase RayT